MRANRWVVLAVLLSGGLAFAQDEPKPEQLKKMYDGALEQLRIAQDRKNELAKDNERLAAQVESMKKELETTRNQARDLQRKAADDASKSFFLRAHYAAWKSFIKQRPEVLVRWKAYLDSDFLRPPGDSLSDIRDSDWPLSREG